jgi:hypothetical protein
LEDSTITCFTRPGVTAITVKNERLTGILSILGDNITPTSFSHVLLLSVIDPTRILTKNNFSSSYGNCKTPLIQKINTVLPDEDGNIDIFGIQPVKITISSGKIVVALENVTLLDICPEKGDFSPPSDATDSYYTDILTTNAPEWTTWPQFT